MVRKKNHSRTGRRLFAVLCVLFLTVGAFAVIQLIHTETSYAASQTEYEELRKYAPIVRITAPVFTSAPAMETAVTSTPPAESEPEAPPALSEINPDYIGWISVAGTFIDYPVVQGQDNSKYLSISFSGWKNPSGTIFADYRHAEGFSGNFTILYGHNMKDGSMFADLNNYLTDGYLDEHPDVTITTPEGETLTYRVFAVKVTDVSDPVYRLVFSGIAAPNGAGQTLILSTCTDGENKEERLLVFAQRR